MAPATSIRMPPPEPARPATRVPPTVVLLTGPATSTRMTRALAALPRPPQPARLATRVPPTVVLLTGPATSIPMRPPVPRRTLLQERPRTQLRARLPPVGALAEWTLT